MGGVDAQESLLASSWLSPWQATVLARASPRGVSSTRGHATPSPWDTAAGTGNRAPASPTQSLMEHIQQEQRENWVEKHVLTPLAVGWRIFSISLQ